MNTTATRLRVRKSRILVITILIVFNGLLFLVSKMWSWSSLLQSESQHHRNQWKYALARDIDMDAYTILSQITNGDIARFESLAYDIVPSWNPDLNRLVKASFLLQRDQTQAALDTLRQTPTTPHNTLSLSLALRSHIYCLQKDFEACYTLSQEAKKLDPSSALAHMVSWYASRTLKLYKEGQNDFATVDALSGTVTGIYKMQRWVTAFYARDLDKARDDLESFVDDPVYNFDALVFLWRTAYDQQDYDTAIKRFEEALMVKEYKNRIPYMRLGRIAMRKDDLAEAEKQYNYSSLLVKNNTELLTDQLYLYYKLWNTDKIQELTKTIQSSIPGSSSTYEVFGRRSRNIGQLDISEQYLRDGTRYLADIENEFIRSETKNRLQYQLAATLLQKMYENIYTKETSDVPISAQLDEIKALWLNTRHIDTYIARSAFKEWDYIWAKEQMQTIFTDFWDIEMIAMRFWWAVGRWDFDSAWDIIWIRPDEDPNRDDETKKIRERQYTWMLAILHTYQWNPELAYTTLSTLSEDPDRVWPPNDGPYTKYRLLTQAHSQFWPWIYWITPYIDTP